MIRIAICDDSTGFLQQTDFIIRHWDHTPCPIHTEIFEDGDALLQAHKRNPFHIILLDVIMPLLNGIEAAAELRQKDSTVKIVFLTSSPDFAIDSYRVKASNYLLKPFHPDDLFTCLNELISDIMEHERCITIRSGDIVHRIRLSDIEFIESQNKHVLFNTIHGRTITSAEPLYSYEDKLLLKDGFFRCHRSYVVNIHHIGSYSSKEILMRSGYRIPISRNWQKEFDGIYFSVIFGEAGDVL